MINLIKKKFFCYQKLNKISYNNKNTKFSGRRKVNQPRKKYKPQTKARSFLEGMFFMYLLLCVFHIREERSIFDSFSAKKKDTQRYAIHEN